jgi:hypothetical protein
MHQRRDLPVIPQDRYFIMATTTDTDPILAWNFLASLDNEGFYVDHWEPSEARIQFCHKFLQKTLQSTLFFAFALKGATRASCISLGRKTTTSVPIRIERTSRWYSGIYTCEDYDCPGRGFCIDCRSAQRAAWIQYRIDSLTQLIERKGLVTLENVIARARAAYSEAFRAALGSRRIDTSVIKIVVDYAAPPSWNLLAHFPRPIPEYPLEPTVDDSDYSSDGDCESDDELAPEMQAAVE